MNDVTKYSEQTFDGIKHVNDSGQEFWYVRELQVVLEYSQWRRFLDTIERAKLACKNSGYQVEDHFADVGKMVTIGSGAERKLDDYMLSRYACYLIVMNGDPRTKGPEERSEELSTPEKSIQQIEKEKDENKLK